MRQNDSDLNTKLGNKYNKKKQTPISGVNTVSVNLQYEPQNTTDPPAHHRLYRVLILTNARLSGIPKPPLLFNQPTHSA